MNAENFFKEMFYNIWQGNNVNKINDFYSKDFIEEICISENDRLIEHTMYYDEIVKQANLLKENYKNITVDFKIILSAEKNHIAVNFHSTATDRRTEIVQHRFVSGIWRLNYENKIDRVWAVVIQK